MDNNKIKKLFGVYAAELNFDKNDWKVFIARIEMITKQAEKETIQRCIEIVNDHEIDKFDIGRLVKERHKGLCCGCGLVIENCQCEGMNIKIKEIIEALTNLKGE